MENVLSEIQLDIIKELMNVGVNESTNILSNMLKVDIELTVPLVKVLQIQDLMSELSQLGSGHLTAVNLKFQNSFSGNSQLIFSSESANKLINIFSREVLEIEELDEIKSGALVEIGNIVLNAVLAEFSNFLKHDFEFFVPDFYENYEKDFFSKIQNYADEVILMGHTLFSIVEYEISGDIIIMMKMKSFRYLLSILDNYLLNI